MSVLPESCCAELVVGDVCGRGDGGCREVEEEVAVGGVPADRGTFVVGAEFAVCGTQGEDEGLG